MDELKFYAAVVTKQFISETLFSVNLFNCYRKLHTAKASKTKTNNSKLTGKIHETFNLNKVINIQKMKSKHDQVA